MTILIMDFVAVAIWFQLLKNDASLVFINYIMRIILRFVESFLVVKVILSMCYIVQIVVILRL